MDLRLSFDTSVILYDRLRPKYVPKVFEDIINYSSLNNKKFALEIGCGTGQATEPILKLGCNVTAVEYGSNMCNFVQDKFSNYKNFKAENITFEDFNCSKDSIDLIYSATAFHWIPEDIAYKKSYELLKSGGTLALFWNKPFVSRCDDLLHIEIQKIYSKYILSQDIKTSKIPIKNDIKRYEKIKSTIKKHGFKGLEFKLYKSQRQYNAEDYILLLNTYSDHISMNSSTKLSFENEIKTAINNFGGILNIYDTIDLYLTKKP